MRVMHLVDDLHYAKNNCFQHQLSIALQEMQGGHRTTMRTLDDLLWGRCYADEPDVVVSCLKQRTLAKCAELISRKLPQGIPFNAYEQDPWESFKVGSPHRGSYAHISFWLPQVHFHVTTPWWADHLVERGYRASYVPMWVLPEYCVRGLPWELRRGASVAFYGTLHSHRRTLVESLGDSGIKVQVDRHPSYPGFLAALSNTQVFVHSEDEHLDLDDGTPSNMSLGMWVKDIEAAARGCWSVRNRDDHRGYLEGVETVVLYDDVRQAASAVMSIQAMDPEVRQARIDRTVEHVRSANRWQETAAALVGSSRPSTMRQGGSPSQASRS